MVQEIKLSKQIIKALAMDLYDVVVQDIKEFKKEETITNAEREFASASRHINKI